MPIVSDHYFPSSNGTGQIHYRKWSPESGEIRAVVQLTHGVAEHIARYGGFADFLTKHGFVVVGQDHLGHGDSVRNGELYGFFSEKEGWEYVVRDMRTLMLKTKEEYPAALYFMFGHSMGSFLLRTFLIQYQDAGLKGTILSGTGQQNSAALRFGLALSAREARKYGLKGYSSVLNKLTFGGYNKAFVPARTTYDWLSRDWDIVDRYISDEKCGFDNTICLLKDMIGGMCLIQQKKNLRRMDKRLPVLFISGEQDPVGSMGKGVRKAYKSFIKAGVSDISIKLYPRGRHEMLNELNRQEVYNDILTWMESKISAE